MTKQNLETAYCNERGDRSFNDYNNNDYTKFLESELIKQAEQLRLCGVGVTLPCKNEYAIEVIQNALYSTGKFTTDSCTNLTEGIMMCVNDANLEFTEQGN